MEFNIMDVLDKVNPDDVELKEEHIPSNISNTSYKVYLYYIRNKIDVDIPASIANEQDENGFTLAMHYLYVNPNIPKSLRHNPDIQDTKGWTIAMHWVSVYHTTIPEWMRCDKLLVNESGKNIGMFWLLYTQQPLEDWMTCDQIIKDNEGYTIEDYIKSIIG